MILVVVEVSSAMVQEHAQILTHPNAELKVICQLTFTFTGRIWAPLHYNKF